MRTLLAPFVLAVTLAVFVCAVLSNDASSELAVFILFGTHVIVAVILTAFLFQFESNTRPDVRTHLRQCFVLYMAALFGWAMQGEGLTAHAGVVISRGASAVILGQVASSVLSRTRRRSQSHSSSGVSSKNEDGVV